MKDRSHQCIHWIRAEIINGQGDQLSMEQRPQLLGIPEQGGISAAESEPSAEPVANTESLFSNLLEPQDGHSA